MEKPITQEEFVNTEEALNELTAANQKIGLYAATFPFELPLTLYYPSKHYLHVGTIQITEPPIDWRQTGDKIIIWQDRWSEFYLTEKAAKEQLKDYASQYIQQLKEMLDRAYKFYDTI